MCGNTIIYKLILSLDVEKDTESIREQLVTHGKTALPEMLICFPSLRKLNARRALIYSAVKFARVSEDAKKLGLMGLRDKSKVVRYYACALAAFSLSREFLPELELLLTHTDHETVADAQAAIHAIRSQDHNFFIDRSQNGAKWHVAGAEFKN